MVSINYAFKEIWCKIVYYGPGLSGKTTNLQYAHQKIPSPSRGELISLATDQDRTLYFDFLPVDIGNIHGFSIKFQLYTVPGQVYYNATRKLVLRGVDGLVFVADSQRSKMDENIESYQNLLENVREYGYDPEKLPLVFQYNKRDLSDISSVDELESILNPQGLPHFEAVATEGVGVFDTLKCISKLVLDLTKGKKVVPEREVPAEEAGMEESKPARPERVTDLEDLKTPASVNLFPERLELLKTKDREAITQEKLFGASESEGWSGSAHPHGCPQTEAIPSPPGQAGECLDEREPLPAQHQTEHETSTPEKIEGFETKKEEISFEGLTQGGEGKSAEGGSLPAKDWQAGASGGKIESGPSLPKAGESPTIISWSAAKQKNKFESKGFFLWRFLKKLLNR
jgi:signal recognition particle receptor subunit beta